MHNLHHIPLPKFSCDIRNNADDALNKDICHYSDEDVKERAIISREWMPFIETLRLRKEHLHSRLVQW